MERAWNEIHHININDLLFALGLRERRPSSELVQGRLLRNGNRGQEQQEGASQSNGRDEEASAYQPIQQSCKADICLEREEQLEKLLDQRVTVQGASIRVRKRRAAAGARATVSEAARDEKQEELEDISKMLQSGEAARQSLRDKLSWMKARCAALGEIMHDLSAEQARQKREEAIDSMPAHLRRTLPSNVADAKRELNFSSPPSRHSNRPQTVFAILEDGMPGGRLETREESSSGQSESGRGAFSLSCPGFDRENAVVWPTTPPRCRLGTGAKFPPLQLAVSPIQSSSSVIGGVLTLGEDEISRRRARQKSRIRRRVKEWWESAGSIDVDVDCGSETKGHGHRNCRHPRTWVGCTGGGDWRDWRSTTASDHTTSGGAAVGRRSAWASPVSEFSASAVMPPSSRSMLSQHLSPPPASRRFGV